MGNSRITKNSQFYQQEIWKSAGKQITYFNGKPNISYLASSKLQTQYVGLEYIIQHQEQNSQTCQQMMMYQLRQCMNHPNVIGVYYFNKGKSIYKFFNKEIDSNKNIFRVITQYIQIRVCDMKLLNAHQAIQLFKGAAFGTWQIVKHLGGFTITPQMIGIDNKGNVKVWINSNFAENTVQFQIKQNFGERQMCLQLFKIFDQSICGNQILPNRNEFLSINTLVQLVNYLFDLTQCEANKELMLQLVLKQNTFKNIQQISKIPNKFYSTENIKSVQNYYQSKKIKPNRNKAQLNVSDNQISKVYLYSQSQNNSKQFSNENFQRDYHYMHSYPDKPIHYKQTNPLSVCNSQCSPRYYNSQYINNNLQQPKVQSFYSQENIQSKYNSSNNKSKCITKVNKVHFKQPQILKKNFSTSNFQKMISIPNIQVTQEQLRKNKKHYQSQLFHKNLDLNGYNHQGDNINTADSPTMKLKMRQQKQMCHTSYERKYQKIPFQTNFTKKRKIGGLNNKFSDQKIDSMKKKYSLAQKLVAGPIQAKKSFMNQQKNMSIANQSSSIRINDLNSSVNFGDVKTRSLKQKQQSSNKQTKLCMIQIDQSKVLKKQLQKQNNINLFDSKNFSKNSFSSIAQEQQRKNYSQIELQYLKNFLSQPQSECQSIKYQNSQNCSQYRKDDQESQKNISEYLKLSLGSQSISNNSSEPILQKLHFSKQKKGVIPKIGHRSTFCLQNQNNQNNRNRCRIVQQDNFQHFKDKIVYYIRQQEKNNNLIEDKSILIGQGKFPTTIYNLLPTDNYNGEALWQSCNLDIQNANDNVFDPFGASCLRTIKQTQREKDLSSYYGEHSDGRQFIKDPLTGSEHFSRKIQRIP